MRTSIDLAPEWRESQRDDGGALVTIGDAEGTPVSWIDIEPLVASEDAPAPAVLALRLRGEVTATRELTTRLGWTTTITEVTSPSQLALIVQVQFLHHVGTLIVRARDRPTLAQLEPQLSAALGSARPDWRDGTIRALVELWR